MFIFTSRCPTACSLRPRAPLAPTFGDCQHRTAQAARLLAVVALLSWLAAMSALLFVAPAQLPAASGPLAFGYFFLAALVPAFLGPAYFGWYLAIAGLLDGHNNEVGGAARITAHRELIRFHIDTEGALTGYVIAVEQEGTPARGIDAQNRLIFRLIDRFTLASGTKRRRVDGASCDSAAASSLS
jgi:hypothetical protein